MALRKDLLAILLTSTIFSPGSYPDNEVGMTEEKRDASIKAQYVPHSLQSVRSMQLQMAEKSGVKLKILERGEMSATTILGVPNEVGDIPIHGQHDLEIVLQALAPYFGFSGTESLEIRGSRDAGNRTIYDIEQFINGYPTGQMLEIWVSKESSKITRISGYASIDKGLPITSKLDEKEAIRLVREAIMNNGMNESRVAFENTDLDIYGEVKSTLFYREDRQTRSLSLWWGIGVPLKNPHKFDGGEITHQWYRVSPGGKAELWIDGAT